MIQRYAQFAVTYITPNGAVMSGLPFIDMKYTGKFVMHKVQPDEAGRLDLIAWRYLKNTDLWWAIGLYNTKTDENPDGIQDPIRDVVPGKFLAIPTDALNFLKNFQAFTYLGTI